MFSSFHHGDQSSLLQGCGKLPWQQTRVKDVTAVLRVLLVSGRPEVINVSGREKAF